MFITGFLIFSCAKDDEPSNDEVTLQPKDLAIIELENTPLDIANFSVSINGATEKTAEIIPNGAIALTVPSTKSLAFSGEGFTVKFNSDADFKGVYLQLQNTDGTKADSYFDKEMSSSSSSYKKFKSSKNIKATFLSKNAKMAKKNEDAPFEFDVDFGAAIQLGTFCYSICAYDAEGNVSEPQEVCVTVKAFGGNSNLVGTWSLSKSIEGEKTVYPYEIYDEGYVNARCKKYLEDLSIQSGGTVIYNADGTYSYTYNVPAYISTKEVIYDYETCTIVKEETQEKAHGWGGKGKWSYDATSKRLITVEVSYLEYDAAGNLVYEDINEEVNFRAWEVSITIFESYFVELYEADEWDPQEAMFYFDKK